MGRFDIPPLPFPPEAYGRLASAETIAAHRAAADSCSLLLTVATDGYPDTWKKTPEQLCRTAHRFPKTVAVDICFGAGGVFCHELYFRYLLPDGRVHLPAGYAADFLSSSFGSVESFFYRFRTLAREARTNGFLWLLVRRRHGRAVCLLDRTEDYALPDTRLGEPIFCLDLWEHAYVGRFGEDRAAYADTYLKMLDWLGVAAAMEDSEPV
ncbi:MAG: hypothetical protein MJ088_02340 [Clostridia bacterium]|nr:hypothetical protein [Clostridia bacterium]